MCPKCNAITDTAEELDQHTRVSHMNMFQKFAKKVLRV